RARPLLGGKQRRDRMSAGPIGVVQDAARGRGYSKRVPTLLSQLFVRTLKEDPADAEATSHKLLVRAGYIRRQAPGVFAWLPLGLRVRANIERVIREEMAAAGAQEVLFPALLPREPYEATGRWEEYGDNLFRLKDRKGADYLDRKSTRLNSSHVKNSYAVFCLN